MKRLIKRLSVLILLIFSISAQVWASTDTYYATMTAKLSNQSPTGSGLVYVNTSNSDDGATYAETSSILGQNSSTGNNADVAFFLFAHAERGYYFQGWSNDVGGAASNNDNPWNATINSSSTSSPGVTDTKYAIFKLRQLPTGISVSPAAITMLEGEDRMVTYTLTPDVPNLFNCVEASATSGGGFINIPTTLV